MNISNKYKIGQSSFLSKYKDYYDWAIWIDEEENVLENIESVTYMLHATFPNPVKVIKDKASKFKLKTSGWGTFMIKIKIDEKGGDEVFQQHFLVLEENYDSTQGKGKDVALEPKEDKKKKVFLSYSSLLQKYADEITNKLNDKGIEVVDANKSPEGESVFDFIESSMDDSDSIISLESKFDNPWVGEELQMAKEKQKPIHSIKMDDIDFDKDLIDQKISITSLEGNSSAELNDFFDELGTEI